MLRTSALLVVFMLASAPAVATDRVVLSLAQLHQAADAVAVGRLDNSDGEWLDGRILTRHQFTATEVWAGDGIKAKQRFELTTLGGIVGEIGQRVSGQVLLPGAGAELAMFLVWDPKSVSYRLVGMSQGVFNVKRAAGETDGLVLRDQFAPNVDQESPILTLAKLRQRVRELEREK
ncbi:MAG: hypothetical protein AAF654_00725 [Myxococcota bacterium]